MKQGWELKAWSEVLEIRSGRNQKEVLNPNGSYPILGSAGSVMGYADNYICEEGTTIIGRKGTIDKPLFINSKFWNVDTAFGLVAGESLEKKFLYYFCLGYDFKSLDKGTTLPSLVKKDLVNITIPVPPLPEQKRIVAKLDKAFEAIDQANANVERNLQNAKDLFQSELNKIFSQKGDGWVDKSLDDLSGDLITKGATPTTYGFPFVEDGIPFLRSECVSDNGFNAKGIRFISEGAHEMMKRSVVKKGDILISITGNVGRVVRYPDDMVEGNINQHIARVRIAPEVANSDFIVYQLKSDGIQSHYQNIFNGTAYPLLSLKQIRETRVLIPNSVIQNQIVTDLNHLHFQSKNLQINYQQEIITLDELKKSILQKAFNGEL